MLKSLKKRSQILVMLILSLVLALSWVFYSKYRIVHPVSAKEYIENVQAELNSLEGQIHYYQGSFAKVENLFGQAQTAYYEITNNRTYFDSVEDTKGDIQDLEKVLHQLDQLEEKRKLERPPAELEPLATILINYYQTIRKPLELLLLHEETQMNLLNAAGDELHYSLDKLGKVKTSDEYLRLILQLETLSRQSYERMRAVPIPEAEVGIFQSTFDFYAAEADYFSDLAQLIRAEDQAFNEKRASLDAQLIARNEEIVKERDRVRTAWLDATPMKADFIVAAKLEAEIHTYLNNFFSPAPAPEESTSSAKPNGKVPPGQTKN